MKTFLTIIFLFVGSYIFAQNLAPTADFSVNQAADCFKKYIFQDQSLNSPTTFLWDFGDGTTSILQNPTHQYLVFGNFTVTFSAQNLQGTDTKQRQISITNNLNISSGMTNGNAVFQGISTINAKNIVNFGANSTYRAEKFILLKAGFRADSASIFKAEIGGCL